MTSSFEEYLNDPAWAINDSVDMIEYHVKKLVDLALLTDNDAGWILSRLPKKPELPEWNSRTAPVE